MYLVHTSFISLNYAKLCICSRAQPNQPIRSIYVMSVFLVTRHFRFPNMSTILKMPDYIFMLPYWVRWRVYVLHARRRTTEKKCERKKRGRKRAGSLWGVRRNFPAMICGLRTWQHWFYHLRAVFSSLKNAHSENTPPEPLNLATTAQNRTLDVEASRLMMDHP